jgi:hypothetical protein
MLVTELIGRPGIRVIERAQMQDILTEQRLSLSGRVDESTALEVGKLLGAQYVIHGQVTSIVDVLRMDGKRYFYVDGMVRQWVRLHATGRPASTADIRRAFDSLEAAAPTPASGQTQQRAEAPTERPALRRDSLMEID